MKLFNAIAAAAVIGTSFIAPNPAKADLGSADVTKPGTGSSGNSYQAWCGEKKENCKVRFSDGRLVVNNGNGIQRTQVINTYFERVCRRYFLGLPDCFRHQFDKEYTITYLDSNSSERSALITFSHEKTYKKFDADFRIWADRILRPVGPSIVIEQNKSVQAPANGNTILSNSIISKDCKAPLSDYGCSWTKYLSANPSLKRWAEENPKMAEKERLRVNASQ
jgi:hypothetical protein